MKTIMNPYFGYPDKRLSINRDYKMKDFNGEFITYLLSGVSNQTKKVSIKQMQSLGKDFFKSFKGKINKTCQFSKKWQLFIRNKYK